MSADSGSGRASWQQLTAKYQNPDTLRSLWQLGNSAIAYLILWYLMYRSLAVSYWLTLALSLLAIGCVIRTFIIFHDCGHGAFFRSKKANDIVGFITGVLTFTPYYKCGASTRCTTRLRVTSTGAPWVGRSGP